ncbi:tumor necrosis factor receptor superfamily member 14-like isoform X1 [Centropristis striata]|uniref:tumor necrosis factor receptor superfamily member 14-like isoform X1 n=1 Tax=Centropristis striata TaxID=184440 RepID=UPI0027E008EB|nr:tumor necrosis factor receptor superfamily member 14-like isoform X1 [Centropristis striata]XP_059188734.1 tumor necrosis factor receptor superfamily member 14-like isoform X1 [Centropristis striata]
MEEDTTSNCGCAWKSSCERSSSYTNKVTCDPLMTPDKLCLPVLSEDLFLRSSPVAGNRVVKDCTEFRSTSCVPCLNETFMDHPAGLQECFGCAKCDAGSGLKIKRPCTGTSDTACEPLEGFYCFDSTEDGCVAAHKHTYCLPGQYISRNGTALRDTECSDCSDGTFSDGTFFTCQPHKQCESINLHLIKAGSTSTDNECGVLSPVELGIVIGAVVFVLLLIVIVVLIFVRRYIRNQRCQDSGNSKDQNTKQSDYGSLQMNSTDEPSADTKPKLSTAELA